MLNKLEIIYLKHLLIENIKKMEEELQNFKIITDFDKKLLELRKEELEKNKELEYKLIQIIDDKDY